MRAAVCSGWCSRRLDLQRIDAGSGQRQLIWAELDANPSSDSDRNLFIRPGRNFLEGHRYVVALRGLRRADGSAIEPQRPFRVYRDGIVTSSPAVEARRPHMEDLFGTLGRAGIARTAFPSGGSVYEPWDAGAGFNTLAPNANTPPVASAQNQDPHGVPRRTAAAQDQKSDHLQLGGTITDRCAGGPCHGVP